MSNYFYLDQWNIQRGPVTKEQLLINGIAKDTMVWTNGMDNWKKQAKRPIC